MAFKIEETFQVQAPVDRVWRYLIDPRQVVDCLPGAELTEAQDDQTFLGKVKVKVGPVTAAYNGRAKLTEVNEQEHQVRIVAEGRETGGAGSAKMTMTSLVVAAPSGGSEVKVNAELDVAGKIMQFGRGMIDTVSKQLFRQFSDCVRDTLEVPAAPAPSAAPVAAPADATRVAGASAASAGFAPGAQPQAPRARMPRAKEPVRILPLMFKAAWTSVRRLFGKTAKT
jgi:uncharacterized protein